MSEVDFKGRGMLPRVLSDVLMFMTVCGSPAHDRMCVHFVCVRLSFIRHCIRYPPSLFDRQLTWSEAR